MKQLMNERQMKYYNMGQDARAEGISKDAAIGVLHEIDRAYWLAGRKGNERTQRAGNTGVGAREILLIPRAACIQAFLTRRNAVRVWAKWQNAAANTE